MTWIPAYLMNPPCACKQNLVKYGCQDCDTYHCRDCFKKHLRETDHCRVAKQYTDGLSRVIFREEK